MPLCPGWSDGITSAYTFRGHIPVFRLIGFVLPRNSSHQTTRHDRRSWEHRKKQKTRERRQEVWSSTSRVTCSLGLSNFNWKYHERYLQTSESGGMMNALLAETVFNKHWCNILALVAVNRFIIAIIYRTKPWVHVELQKSLREKGHLILQ